MSARQLPARLIKRVRAIAFDLDGTLIDTAPDLSGALNHMLVALQLPALADDQVRGMIGDGVDALVQRALDRRLGHAPPEPVQRRGLELFREAYGNALYQRSRVYPGVRDTLQTLRSAGLRLACVTNKSAGFTVPLLAQAGLNEHFDHILCASSREDRKPSPALLRTLCSRLDIIPASVLMVGDSQLDIRAARAAGCPVAVVVYGYTPETSLRAVGPDWVISNLQELPSLEVQAA